MNRKRVLTLDREGTGPPLVSGVGAFHTTEKIGIKRHRTPEGFLLCMDVPAARTGWMMYAPGEVPVAPGPDGYIMVARDAATLFHPTTIMSALGKPVTNDHPPKGVDPRNWKDYAVGTLHNPRQGTGDDHDVMLCDLLITDERAIADVESGKVEVSLGYDALYEKTGIGLGRQRNIVINHIALVGKGRCGPRCAIGDQLPTIPTERKATMATAQSKPRKAITVSPIMRQLILDQAAELQAAGPGEDEEGDGDGNGVHVHIHTGDKTPSEPLTAATAKVGDAMDERLSKLETSLATVADSVKALADKLAAAPQTTTVGDAAVTDSEGTGIAGDSKALETGFRAVMADAEVLVPGFALPTFDGAQPRKITVDSMCSLRKRVLDAFYLTADGKTTLDTLAGGAPAFDKMSCSEAAILFRSASGSKKLLNNRAMVGDGAGRIPHQDDGVIKPKKQTTIADIEALNRKMYPQPGSVTA